MNHTPIYISRDDNAKLRVLLATALYSGPNPTLRKLREELNRAAIVDSESIPTDVVTLDSSVEFEDLDTGEVEEYTLTLPDRADAERKRISILTPIGTAFIGCRAGDVVKWFTPVGIRQLRVRRVAASTESASVAASPDFATSATA